MIYRQIQTEPTFKDFAVKNIEQIEWLYSTLGDEKSRETFKGFLAGRVTADYHCYDRIFVGESYFVDDIITLGAEEAFVDCGAYIGDTIEDFIKKVISYQRIYAFEPDAVNREILYHYIREHDLLNIEVDGRAVWNESATLTFDTTEDTLSRVSSGGKISVPAVPLDLAVTGRITYIKMDIEGAEYEALEGARSIITRYRPKLAICVYHKYQDVIRVPKLIDSMVPGGYRFYLRHHAPYGAELILYAIPVELSAQ